MCHIFKWMHSLWDLLTKFYFVCCIHSSNKYLQWLIRTGYFPPKEEESGLVKVGPLPSSHKLVVVCWVDVHDIIPSRRVGMHKGQKHETSWYFHRSTNGFIWPGFDPFSETDETYTAFPCFILCGEFDHGSP